ncbi:MAG TPA: response regulator, partial [Phycisphaerae bacterium]
MGRRVLVIEDDTAIRLGITDALRFEGYEPCAAADGRRGREMAIEIACDLVLLDLVLPGGDGLSILRDIREVRPTLPVII